MTDTMASSMSSDINKADKEAILNERIAAIRRRNDEIKRRHEEVLADKKNASIVKQILLENSGGSDLRMFAEEKIAARKYSSSSSGSTREKRDWRALSNVGQANNPDSEMRSSVRPTEDDAPPPDPPFTYLTDRLRDGAFCSEVKKTRPRKKSNASDSGNSSIGSSRKTSTVSDFSLADSDGADSRKISLASETGDYFKRKISDTNSAYSDGFWSRKSSSASDASYMSWSRKSSDCSVGSGRILNPCKYEVELDEEGRVKVKVIPGTVMGQKRLVRRHASFNLLAPPHNEARPMSPEEKEAYDIWRRERVQLDQERMERQKTHQGSWRREWDNQKLDQELDEHIAQESFFTRRMQKALEKEKEAQEKQKLALEKEQKLAMEKEQKLAMENEQKETEVQSEDAEIDRPKPPKTKPEKRQKPSPQELHSNWRERKQFPASNGVVMKLADIIKELGIAKDNTADESGESKADTEAAEPEADPNGEHSDAADEGLVEEMENDSTTHDDEGFDEDDHCMKSCGTLESDTEQRDADLVEALSSMNMKVSPEDGMVECNNNYIHHDVIDTIYEADEEGKELAN